MKQDSLPSNSPNIHTVGCLGLDNPHSHLPDRDGKDLEVQLFVAKSAIFIELIVNTLETIKTNNQLDTVIF